MNKSINFPASLGQKIAEIAEINRRSFSAQVVYMIENMINEKSGQGNELAQYIEALR